MFRKQLNPEQQIAVQCVVSTDLRNLADANPEPPSSCNERHGAKPRPRTLHSSPRSTTSAPSSSCAPHPTSSTSSASASIAATFLSKSPQLNGMACAPGAIWAASTEPRERLELANGLDEDLARHVARAQPLDEIGGVGCSAHVTCSVRCSRTGHFADSRTFCNCSRPNGAKSLNLWYRLPGSNGGPPDPQSGALTN